MVKRICSISIVLVLAAIIIQPAWGAAPPDIATPTGAIWIGHNGYGPGDGSGNDGDGPGDGTGNGPGDCSTSNPASFDQVLMAKQNAGSGNNGGYGPGDGTGNDGDGPADGTGNGPGDC